MALLPAFERNCALHSVLLDTTLSFEEILPVLLILTAALLPAFEWNCALHSVLLGTTLSFEEILPVLLILIAALLPGRLFLVLSRIAPCTRFC